MKLGFTPQNFVIFKNKRFFVNADFKRVIKATALLREENISERARVKTALKLLLKSSSFCRSKLLNHSDKSSLLNAVFELLGTGAKSKSQGKKTLCLEKDGAFIYGAFLQAFGLDLQKDKLDWRVFRALLSCIPESTALFNVMKIRAAEIPKDASQEEAERLCALKKRYSLDEDFENNYDGELEVLFNKLCN
jgi:hypothetical protein